MQTSFLCFLCDFQFKIFRFLPFSLWSYLFLLEFSVYFLLFLSFSRYLPIFFFFFSLSTFFFFFCSHSLFCSFLFSPNCGRSEKTHCPLLFGISFFFLSEICLRRRRLHANARSSDETQDFRSISFMECRLEKWEVNESLEVSWKDSLALPLDGDLLLGSSAGAGLRLWC